MASAARSMCSCVDVSDRTVAHTREDGPSRTPPPLGAWVVGPNATSFHTAAEMELTVVSAFSSDDSTTIPTRKRDEEVNSMPTSGTNGSSVMLSLLSSGDQQQLQQQQLMTSQCIASAARSRASVSSTSLRRSAAERKPRRNNTEFQSVLSMESIRSSEDHFRRLLPEMTSSHEQRQTMRGSTATATAVREVMITQQQQQQSAVAGCQQQREYPQLSFPSTIGSTILFLGGGDNGDEEFAILESESDSDE